MARNSEFINANSEVHKVHGLSVCLKQIKSVQKILPCVEQAHNEDA